MSLDFTMPHDQVLIDVPMPIVTPRLVLRSCLPGDGVGTHGAIKETWDTVSKWMPWADKLQTEAETEANVRRAYAQFILREDMRMIGFRKSDGLSVVFTGLHRFDWKTRRFEIGYFVRQSAQGHGFAQEATNALTRFAFGALGARAVCIVHAEGNEPSRAVIRKLGFVHEGTNVLASRLPDGQIVDQLSYVRTSTEGLPPLDVRWGPS